MLRLIRGRWMRLFMGGEWGFAYFWTLCGCEGGKLIWDEQRCVSWRANATGLEEMHASRLGVKGADDWIACGIRPRM